MNHSGNGDGVSAHFSGTMPAGSESVETHEVVEDLEYVLTDRRWLTAAVAELKIKPLKEAISYVAGQYVLLSEPTYRIPIRSYSIANAPGPDVTLTLLITAVPDGPMSNWLLREVQIGETVLVSGPYGTFVVKPGQSGDIVAVAGGSGWAPIRALAEDVLRRADAPQFSVLFSARTEQDVMDRALVAQWREQYPGFSFVRTLTRESGSLPNGRIQKVMPELWPNLAQKDVYVAGPPGLVAATTETARSLGVDGGRLHTEEFYSDPVPWG